VEFDEEEEENIPPHLGYRDIFYGIGLAFAGIMVALILSGVAIAILLRGQTLRSNEISWLGAVLEIVVYAGAGAGVAALVKLRLQNRWAELGFRPTGFPWLFWAAVAAPVVAFGIGSLTSLLAAVSHQNAGVQACMIQSNYGGAPVLATVAIAVVAPVVEETFFRGVIFGALRQRWPLWTALFASALIFAAAHAISLGGSVLVLAPELFVLGCALAWLRERSKSLYPGMMMHGTFNLLGAIAIFAGSSACHP
jgi:membrane protease YdiL (CAAX protease family)